MESTSPTPRAIPGDGPLGDPSDPVEAMVRFYRAFNERDLSAMEQVWEHSDDVVAMAPLAGIARGWTMLRAGYDRLFHGEVRVETEFYDYTIRTFDDVFYAVGRERGRTTTEGRTIPVTGMATNIFHRAPDGAWKLVHHHISLDMPPPTVPPGPLRAD